MTSVRRRAPLVFAAAAAVAGLVGCTGPTAAAPATEIAAAPAPAAPVPAAPAAPVPVGIQPTLASDPAQLADDLVADERAVRDPSTPGPDRVAAARRQQAAYRAIVAHPDWDAVIRPRIPAELSEAYGRNLNAAQQLVALASVRDTLPAWIIRQPAPAEELLGYYREAEAASGVGWNYLAAVNLVETRFGRVNGASTAGAQGPMQFLPSTFAAYGNGGDIDAPRDAILAAGRYLAANGFVGDPDRALYRYNHSDHYVRAISDYAAVLAADPAAFAGYYEWEVYCKTTAGDVLLPVGYAESAPVPAAEYVAAHPQ